MAKIVPDISVEKLCSRCRLQEAPRHDAYCKPCRSDYNRTWRATGGPTDEARCKDSARAKTQAAARKGLLVIEPCARCGGMTNLMKHHPDYSKPLVIEFLCDVCHKDEHRELSILVRTYRIWLATERVLSRRRENANKRAAADAAFEKRAAAH